MNPVRIAAILLIVLGVLGLVYGGFQYTRETHEATFGTFQMSVEEKKAVTVPVWISVGVIVAGGVLLLFGSKKR